MAIEKTFRLDGSTVLVTGATGNIGSAIALCLAEAGARIVAHCRSDPDRLEPLRGQIEGAGSSCSTVAADLGDPTAIADLFATLDDGGLTADLVVNNAALQPVAAFDSISAQDWRRMHAVNLDGAFRVTQLAARRMGQGGSIVNIASIEGLDPAAGHGHYASSKAALAMLTRAAAQELGPAGIRVNAVSPGLIDRDGLDRDWPEGVRRWQERAPLGRLGTAGDVAFAVLYLLSPAAAWISGANLVVDGGMSSMARW